MGNTVSRITNTGNYLINGNFDEWTGAPVVDSSLQLWLDAGQSASYPGTGNTWTDLSGGRRDATLTNSPSFDSATGSIAFNGINNLAIVNNPYYTYGKEITVSAWCKFSGFNFDLSQAVKDVDAMNSNVWLWHQSTNGFIWYVNDNGTWVAITISSLTTGVWYHITTTASATSLKIYVNGVSTVTGGAISTQILNVPTSQIATNDNRYSTSRAPFSGNMSNISVYNRALTDAEIQKNYNALAPRYGLTPIANVSSQIRTTTSAVLSRGLDEITKPIINDPSMVLYLDAGRTDSYSGTGNTWIDLSGNANNGAMINVPVYNAANSGYFIFNGANTAFQVNRPVQDDFTISFWFNTTSNNGTPGSWYNGMGLVDCEVGGVVNDYGTSIGQGKVMFGVGNPDTTIISTNTYNNGAWHHVTATRIKSTGAMALYIDAVLVGTVTGGTNSQTAATYMRIGSIQLGAPYFNGSISAVQVYNRALISTEIQQNYNAFAPRYNLPTISPVVAKRELTTGTVQVAGNFDEWTGAPIADSSLVLWLDAGQPASYNGSGTIWTDLSGNNNNANFVNGTTYSSVNGGCINFDGINNYVIVPSMTVNLSNGYTVQQWVNINNFSTAGGLFNFDSGPQYIDYWFNAGDSRLRWETYNGNNTFSNTYLNANTWYCLTSTFSGVSTPGGTGTYNIYINGVLDKTGSMASGPSITASFIIGQYAGYKQFLNSSLSFYNRALSASEVSQNFNALRGRYGI